MKSFRQSPHVPSFKRLLYAHKFFKLMIFILCIFGGIAVGTILD